MAKLLTNLLFEPKGKHDPTQAYTIKDTVMSADGSQVYFALQNVPVGIQLNNTEYWIRQIDLSETKAEMEAATDAANDAAEDASQLSGQVEQLSGDVDRLTEEMGALKDEVILSTNLLDVDNRLVGKAISPGQQGAIVDNTIYDISQHIPVNSGMSYTVYGVYRVGFYAADGTAIGVLNLSAANEAHTFIVGADFTTQWSAGAISYMIVQLNRDYLNMAQVNKGAELLPYMEYAKPVNETIQDINAQLADKFYATYETVEIPNGINESNHGRLSLVATKKSNYFSAPDSEHVQVPQDVGYLYLDEATGKFYYSENVYDRPEYLFTFNTATSICDGKSAKYWCPTITPDGDIIFVIQGKEMERYNPIVYPAGNYDNPVKLDLNPTDGYLPAGMTTDTNSCVSSRDNFVLFAEYRANGYSELNGQPMRIWKISKPYTDPANWKVVLTKYYRNTGDELPADYSNTITHWHTVCFDHHTGFYYANSGDKDQYCRVFVSKDKGETWAEVVSGHQMYRTLGYVFTKDACYWGTDASHPNHNLYKASRNADGEVDFSTTEMLAQCRYESGSGNIQRTYNSCLVRNPDGILLLDRAEERTDGLLNLEFYSFEDNELHLIDVLKSSEGAGVTRYGFGNFATTYYQSTQADGIICGGMSYDRRMSLDILNNTSENRLGVTKIKINRTNN